MSVRAFITSGVILRGRRIDPSAEPVDLEAHVYAHLRKAGCVESEREREIRTATEAKQAKLAAEMQAELNAARDAAMADAEAEAALAKEEADALAASAPPAPGKPGKRQRIHG